jgi:hypothetical protein
VCVGILYLCGNIILQYGYTVLYCIVFVYIYCVYASILYCTAFVYVYCFSGVGPRSRRYERTAAMRLIVQPCDEDEEDD